MIFAADGQADTGSGHVFAVQALENSKNALVMLRRDSYAVIGYGKLILMSHDAWPRYGYAAAPGYGT